MFGVEKDILANAAASESVFAASRKAKFPVASCGGAFQGNHSLPNKILRFQAEKTSAIADKEGFYEDKNNKVARRLHGGNDGAVRHRMRQR